MRFLFLGDSITDSERLFTEDGLGRGYVKMISERLTNHDIVNKGFNGFTVFDVMKNLSEDCLKVRPDVVTILVGINDIFIYEQGNKSFDEKNFLRMYDKVLETITSELRCRIVLMSPFIFSSPAYYKNFKKYVESYSNGIRHLSEKYKTEYIPLDAIFNYYESEMAVDLLTIDGIHLTDNGSGVIAEKWLEKNRVLQV